MDSLYVLRNAFKGAFVLVQTQYPIIDGEQIEELRIWFDATRPSADEINNKPDLCATSFEKINDDYEYVFVIKPGEYLSTSGWDGINNLLSEEDSHNYIITSSYYSIKRIKKILLPFL